MSNLHSCDVNVIFSFAVEDQHLPLIEAHLRSVRKNPYIHLHEVDRTFHYTFSKKMKAIGDSILAGVNSSIVELNSRPAGAANPSALVLRTTFEVNIKQQIEKNPDIDSSPWVERFTKRLIGECTFESLMETRNREQFQEAVAAQASLLAEQSIIRFKRNFTQVSEAPRMKPSAQVVWETHIAEDRAADRSIFSDPDDEDIHVAIEYLTLTESRMTSLQFVGCDRNLIDSLHKMKVKRNLKFPDPLNLLLPIRAR